MKHILSHRIVKHLAKEERETKARYVYLGKAYKLPKLVKAGNQEGNHAKIFQKLEQRRGTGMRGKVGSLGLGKTARSWTKLDKSEKDYFFMVLNVKNPTEYRRYLGKFGMKVRK